MASRVEQQYKKLNAELMDQVQKQRIEIGLYKKELIALKHENMELREERILQNARQRQDHIGIVKSLMRRLEIDAESLADSTQTVEQETTSSDTPFVVNRRSQKRRSSKEICQELRKSSALASSIRTISPPRLTHTPSPRRVADIANDSSRTISPNTLGEEPNEAPELTHTPPPRRVAEIANDSSIEEEEEESNTSTLKDDQQLIEEQGEQREKNGGDLITILEDTDEETSFSSYSSSPISCDSTIEEYIQPRQVLRSLDPNVTVEGNGMQTRAKCKSAKSFTLVNDNTNEDQPSIQLPRLILTQSSPTTLDSLISSSYFASDTSKLSPRRSIFEGNLRMSGSNTSTPIPKGSSPQKNTAIRKTSQGSARTSRLQPKIRVRRLNTESMEAEQTTDLSTTCVNGSGRPSRKCRPTQLSEPSLRAKMRNSSVGKKGK